MHRTPSGRVFLSFAVLVAVLVAIPVAYTPEAHAEGIDASSIALEGTTVIEFTNESGVDMELLRIWPGSGATFKSFKAESGWMGERTPHGVLIFTSATPLMPGESVKFGVKMDSDSAGINWRALDADGNQIDTNKTFAEEIPSEQVVIPPKEEEDPSILPGSVFRIIPETPNVGSTIRVVGDGFGADREFNFHIDTVEAGSFTTDEKGRFVTTMNIPGNIEPGRMVFAVIAEDDQEKEISIRVRETPVNIPVSDDIDLEVDGIPRVAHRGTSLDLSGTGNPGNVVTIEMRTQDGVITNSRTAEIYSGGDWSLEEPIIVPLDAPFGKFSITVTDGRESIQRQMTVESNQVIIISTPMLKFDRGETIVFSGTALPDMAIRMVLEDPFGNELLADELRTDRDGRISLSYETTQNSPVGTYTLIATQGVEEELIYAGLGQLPEIPVNLEFDKLNYRPDDIAIITLTGDASDIVSLLIIDPFDKPKNNATSITLQVNGKQTHLLDLSDYVPGIYTAVVSKGTSASDEKFSVGLDTKSGKIEIKTTKYDYEPDDQMLILGETSPNVLLDIILMDPDGDVIRVKETYSDLEGRITESTFRIPHDAVLGTWTITARSGANFDTIDIGVFAPAKDGMSIQVTPGETISGTLDIKVAGSSGNQVIITITSSDGDEIAMLEIVSTDSGKAEVIWRIPSDLEPGVYTVKASDHFRSAEVAYQIGTR